MADLTSGWLDVRPEDDGLPVVVHAPDGTVVAYCATKKIAAGALIAAAIFYPGEFSPGMGAVHD